MATVRNHELDRVFPAFVRIGRRNSENGYGGSISQCNGKKTFESWRIAEEAAGRRVRRQVYRCKYCRKFHVGTRA